MVELRKVNSAQRRKQNRAIFVMQERSALQRELTHDYAKKRSIENMLAKAIANAPRPTRRYHIRQAIRRALLRAGMFVRIQAIAEEKQ